MRLSVALAGSGGADGLSQTNAICHDIGQAVTHVRLLHSLVVFGEPTIVERPLQALGVELAAEAEGTVYGLENVNPLRMAPTDLAALANRGWANLVDIGVVITTEAGTSHVVRTNGCHWAVEVEAFVAEGAWEALACTLELSDCLEM